MARFDAVARLSSLVMVLVVTAHVRGQECPPFGMTWGRAYLDDTVQRNVSKVGGASIVFSGKKPAGDDTEDFYFLFTGGKILDYDVARWELHFTYTQLYPRRTFSSPVFQHLRVRLSFGSPVERKSALAEVQERLSSDGKIGGFYKVAVDPSAPCRVKSAKWRVGDNVTRVNYNYTYWHPDWRRGEGHWVQDPTVYSLRVVDNEPHFDIELWGLQFFLLTQGGALLPKEFSFE